MILSYSIWTPIVFGLIILFYGSEKPSAGVRWLALIGASLLRNSVGFRVTTLITISVLTAFQFGLLF
jgi:hypothetical protein